MLAKLDEDSQYQPLWGLNKINALDNTKHERNFARSENFGKNWTAKFRLTPFAKQNIAAIAPEEGGPEDNGDSNDSGGCDRVAEDDAGQQEGDHRAQRHNDGEDNRT